MTIDQLRALAARWCRVVAFGLVLGLGGQAIAQDTDTDSLNEEEEEEEERVTQEIVVTGSRIKRSEFNSVAPVTIITNERSQLAGLLDPGEILQGTTVASGQQVNDSFSGFVTGGGPGANTLSLRGLGAQRTLILVNGKRWGPSGLRGSTSSVDLTAIPTSTISRFEILKDGASSLYGADAVAGVVNAITKTRLEGTQLNVQSVLPENSGGEAYSIDAAWGKVGSNWSFNISGQYGKQEELVATDRDWSRCDFRPRFTDQDGDGRIDNTVPGTGEQQCFGFLYGSIFNAGIRYDPNLDFTDPNDPFFDGFWNGVAGVPNYTGVGAGPLEFERSSFYRDERTPGIRQSISEGEIISITSFADYDFSIADRNTTAYYELYWNRRESTTNGGFRQFFPVVPASNPFNPIGAFGAPATLAAIGANPAQIVLPSYNLQDPRTEAEIDRYNVFLGLKGDIGGSWTYDAYIGASDSDGTYAGEAWLDDRVTASINAQFDAGGNVVCTDLVNFPTCVAPNFFGTDAMLNGDLPAWRDFVSKDTLGSTTYKSRQFSAYATGDVFELPAGTVAAVFGAEIRREEINDVPDIDAQNDNIWGSTTAQITAGVDTVTEAYMEVEAPIFKNKALAEDLTVTGSFRWTDYDSFGDDTTYRVGLNWQVTQALRFRGTRGTSFRAPDLFEQFLGNQTGFLTIIDPCTNFGASFNPGDDVYDNCISEGLATNFAGTASSIRTITGGNQNLLAETSDSTSVGFILQPGEGGFSVAVNWFDIKLENTVARPTINFVLSDCYGSRNFSSPFCNRISARDALGNLTDVDASLLNVGLERSRGVDIDLLFQKEFSSFDMTVDLTATHISSQQQDLLGQFDEFRGKWSFPGWAAQGDLTVDYRDWTFFYSVDWIGNQAEDPVFDPGTTNLDRPVATGDVTYQHLAARYTGAEWQIIATIRNITDRDPPILGDNVGSQTANRFFNTIPGGGYDLRGRSFILQASIGFGE